MSKRGRKKKKNKIVIIVLAVLFALVLVLGGLYLMKKKEQEKIEKEKLVVKLINDLDVEINSEVMLLSFIDDIKNGEIISKDEKVDTSKLGKKELTVSINHLDKDTKEYKFKINVVDTTKPVIEAKKELTVYLGNSVDLLKDVKVTDNSLEEIKASVSGEYDTKKAGKYNLKYTAKDSSGNESEYDFILNIVSDPNNKTFTTSKGFTGKVVNGITYIDGVLIANKSYNLPSSYAPGLKWETQNAFDKMKADASKEGFNLYIGSGYRSYWDQKSIYNNYVSRDGQVNADTYSARPGHSEHQTGLAIDVCDRNVSACITSGFDNSAQARWMADNCYKYGLILRYLKGKESITGYMYESWHFRYVGVELATKLYNNGNWITMEEYYGIDSKYS